MAHDPTFFGWLTTGAYAAAAATCICAAFAPTQHASSRVPSLAWFALALGIALLGLNKQLDLQTAITSRLRAWAEQDNWYQYRSALQAVFVFTALFISGGVLGLLLRHIGLHSAAGGFTLA